MERDLDVKPGLKIAGCVALVVATLVLVGPYVVYVIGWGFHGHMNTKQRVGVVEFFGIVVDPDGKPLPDVSVSAEITVYSLIGGRRKIHLKELTGQEGEFTVGQRKGIDLLIEPIEKEGYEVRGRRWPEDGWQYWRFVYSPYSRDKHIPDATDPFVFTMDPK